MYSIIIRHVNWSKLRHLEVPVYNLNHVQMFLDCSRGLFSIRFCSMNALLTLEQIIAPVKALMPDSSILKEYCAVPIWIGERVKSSVCSSPQATVSLVE